MWWLVQVTNLLACSPQYCSMFEKVAVMNDKQVHVQQCGYVDPFSRGKNGVVSE